MPKSLSHKITDHKEDAKHFFDAYIKAVPLAVIQFDLQGRILLWNNSAENIFGWKEEELLGKAPPFVPKKKQKEFKNNFNSVLQGKSYSGLEMEGVSKDRSPLMIRMASSPIRDKKKEIIGVLTHIGNITQLARDLEVLKESEEKYRTLAETARDFIIIHDLKGNIHYANPVVANFTGINESDFCKKNVTDFIPADQIENLKKRKSKRLKGDRGLYLYQTELKGMDGDKIPVEINSSAIMSGNKISKILIVARDITERLENEHKMQRYNQRLTMLRMIDQGIIMNHTIQDIAHHTIKKVHQLIGCNWASILLFKEDDEVANIFAVEGEANYLLNNKTMPVGKNARVDRLKKGEILIANDLINLKTPISSFADKLVKEGVRASLSAPLMANEELIGMLSLLSREKDFFTEEHKEIAREVSMHLAVSLQQVTMARQLEESYKELEKRVEERTIELKSKNEQLERMNKLFVGREFRIKELREQIKTLERQLKNVPKN